MALLRTWCHLSLRYRRRVKDFQKRSGLFVHLGCGNTLKRNWVNVDCYPPPAAPGCEIFVTDIRQGLPFASNSVSAVYSEHFFEHIPIEITTKTLLPECFRILASGGVARVGVPDGQLWIEAYAMGGMIGHGATPMMRINDIARQGGHKFLWDYNTLQHALEQAGFTDCRKARAADSGYSVFLDMDQTDPVRVAQTVYIEARKP
jgi:predicted SAM-dependent methyltransferase